MIDKLFVISPKARNQVLSAAPKTFLFVFNYVNTIIIVAYIYLIRCITRIGLEITHIKLAFYHQQVTPELSFPVVGS